MTDSAPLRRLARRVHMRVLVTTGWRRALESLPAALQIVIAAVSSYSIAHFAFGHPAPIIAVTVTITTLGINRDARPRKVLETSIGITVGIAISEMIVLGIGRGAWQLAIVLFATLVVTRAISSNPAFAIAAAVQSSLVVLLPDPAGGAFTRSLDGLIAGAIALAVTALIPRDPRRAAARDARVLFSVFKESLDGVTEALVHGDHQAAELALERLRRTQVLVDNWTASLDTATSIARISPWIHRQLPELAMQARVLKAADLTSRHLRTIARRVSVVAADGTSRPELGNLMAELGNGLSLLGKQVDDRELTGASRSVFEDIARRLDPTAVIVDPVLRESLIVVLMRPLIVCCSPRSDLPWPEPGPNARSERPIRTRSGFRSQPRSEPPVRFPLTPARAPDSCSASRSTPAWDRRTSAAPSRSRGSPARSATHCCARACDGVGRAVCRCRPVVPAPKSAYLLEFQSIEGRTASAKPRTSAISDGSISRGPRSSIGWVDTGLELRSSRLMATVWSRQGGRSWPASNGRR